MSVLYSGIFSLYCHIPYCRSKCPYCDFNSFATAQPPESRYVAALCAELRHYAAVEPWRDGTIDSVYFGGGTPSLFAPASLGRVLDQANRLWRIAAGCEITMEANPATVSAGTLADFRAAGINRLSIGVQSFGAMPLQTLGRIHTAEEARAAVRQAQLAGFDNLSLDLIYAVPGQTLDQWEADLARACELRPQHISAYTLTYEEGTPFHLWRGAGTLEPLPEETEVAMFQRTQQALTTAGYTHYEISNFALPGFECRHNLTYWGGGPYLGIGCGAHSYTPPTVSGWGQRWSNDTQPDAYMPRIATHGHARDSCEILDERQARGEFVFMALRCRAGFTDAAFRTRFGLDFADAFPHIPDLLQTGLLQRNADRWTLTPQGLLLADSVFATFL